MMHGFENMELEYALALLGVKELPFPAIQSNLLVKWVKMLSEEKGEDYVRRQNQRLIFQWQNIVKEFLDEHSYEDYLS
jgi:hypothetical protein